MTKFDELILFITGPTYVRPEVLEAGKLPVFGHRDKEAKLRIEPIRKNLKTIAGVNDDYEVLLIPGTGTDAMEASIRSLVSDNEKVLCVSVGAFGDLYHSIAKNNGKNAELLKFKDGESIDLNRLEDELQKHKPSVVTLTHNETSTGVINDISEACKLAMKYGAMPLVDGVSIFGGAYTNIRESGVAMYSTSTQKCLALPPGFGIGIVSKDALEKAKTVENRGYLTDILKHYESSKKSQTINTTPTQLANQLYFQTEYIVNQEGIEARFERHTKMRVMTHEWVKSLPSGFELLPETKYASPSLTCIKVPKDFDRKVLKDKMRENGYLFDPGYEKLDLPTIRIGHMGDITIGMLTTYLSTLDRFIK
jgi:aspartate aminotransferase-like enzyme